MKEILMAFAMKFETGNDAFEGDNFEFEVARILNDVSRDLELRGKTSGKVVDVNGNIVGEWSLDR